MTRPWTRTSGRRTGVARRLPAVYAAATAAAVLSWAVAGDAWWVQPMNLTTFWWSLPGVILTIVAVALGRRRAAVLFAVPALVWIWSYGTLFIPQGAPVAVPDVRVATFNTYVDAPSIDAVTALAEKAQPDVLLLEEVEAPRQAAVADALGAMYPFRTVVGRSQSGGVMVVSRFPIVEQRPVSGGDNGNRDTAVVMVDVDGTRIQIVPVHLTSRCLRCGPNLAARLELEMRRRSDALAEVLAALDPAMPAVIGGDFNAPRRSVPYRLLTRAGFDDPHRTAGSGPGFTWPNNRWFPVVRIDWIFTRNLVAVQEWVGDGGESDHRPVIVDLAFRQ